MKREVNQWLLSCTTVCLFALGMAGARAQSPPAAGLVLWLDAADGASLKVDPQGRVARWQDRSGGHHDFLAAEEEASRPQTAADAIGGRPAVHFSGGQSLRCPAIRVAPGPVTLFVVSRRSSGQVTAEAQQRLVSGPRLTLVAGKGGAYPAVISDTEQASVPLGPFVLGRSLDRATHFLSGDIAEVLVYDRPFVSEGARQVVLDYLRAKWHAAVPAHTGDWTRVGGLGPTPAHARADLPLSDQKNQGRWLLDKRLSDEFTGDALDARRWHLAPTSPGDWTGRQPALFLPSNVTIHGGELEVTFRKGDVPEMARYPGQGYAGYTSAFVRTTARSGYGYYEVRAKPMNSAASSAFWLTDTGLSDNQTEIDVFEIGGKARDFERKYNMNAHVWATPQEKRHWSVGGVWVAPWNLADDYHVYGFEWSRDALTWYVDGVPVRRAKNTNWFFPMYVVFDSEAMWSWFGQVNDADLPSTFHIQYLRVWRHGGTPRP